ncbi:hypothetical protein Ahy_B01g056087 [Arachis hypogaea]|uniref:PB1-like domain-containing protein n=1 Tax=Arachis hypogaea TaxID=3818 RepID=A0A445AY35_ARAHY|nr:hypothetical protein Ahy_B01g056087 [Arachis hypogaea]
MFRLQGGTVRYLGGETSIVDYCDEDEWSLIEVYEIVSRQGYLKKDIAAMWYKAENAGLEDGLTMLKTDKDAMDMARIGVKDDMVEVYVVHKTSEVGEVVQPGQLTAPAEEGDQAGPGPIVVYDGPGVGSKAATDGPTDGPTDGANDGPTEVEEVGSMSEGSCEVVKSDDAVEEDEEGSETSEDDDYEPRGSESSWTSDSIAGNASTHSLGSLDFGDSDDEREGAEGLVDVNITEEGEKESAPNQSHGQSSQQAAQNLGKEKVVGDFGDEDTGYNSEEFLDTPFSDDEDDPGKRYPIHRPLKNMSEYTWEVGTLYVSREEFKDCATAYAVSSGRGLRFTKVDLKRVKVECVEGCDWYAYCGKMKHERSWQLKSCNNKHNCSRELKIGIMHARWLSKVFLNKIAENPKIKLTTLMRKAYTKWNVELTKSKASRVRQFALDELQGTYVEQYRRLYDYCHELLRTNPGSSVHLKHVVYPVNGPNLWDRTQFEDVLPPTYRKPIGRPKKKRARGADEQATRTGLSREGQQQKCSYCLCSGHNKRSCPKKHKVTPNPTVNNVATSTSKGRKRQGVRKSSRLSAKTDSGKAADSGSRKQRGSNNKPPSHPKRKPPVSSQQSQAASKRAKVNHSQTASAPAPTTTRVLPSPVKRVTQSQLRFMAKTPPRAWKKVE